MKKIAILLFFSLFYSCEIQYDGDTKLVIKGKISDRNNIPLANKSINVYVSRESMSIPFVFYIPSESNYIGKATTDSNGNYTIVIPKPTNFTEIIVETNDNSNDLNPKQFRNIQLSNFINYQYLVPNTKLYQKSSLTNLNVFLNNINPNIELLNIEYLGNIPNEMEMINPFVNTYGNFTLNLNVEKNQTIILKYTIKDHSNNTISVLQQNVTIDNSNSINYTLNY